MAVTHTARALTERRRAMPKAEESSAAERAPLLLPAATIDAAEAPAPEHMAAAKPVAASDAATPTAVAGREDFFDNAKGMTVLVVIFSHTCMTYTGLFDVAVLRACFLMGALVAMPAFSFLSGHLSSATLTPRRQVGIAKMLLIFIIYQILYFLAGQGFSWAPHNQPGVQAGMGAHKQAGLPLPVWGAENVSWFLACLIVWRAVLPLFARLHRPILVSLVIAMLSILTDAGVNFMPIFGFFPFFMLGHTYSRENLWEIHTTKNAICFFIAPFLFFIALSFAASSGMEQMGMGQEHHAAHKGGDDMPKINPDALAFMVPSIVVEGGFQCLYMQIASGNMHDPGGANKPHRRQLGVGVGCYDVGIPLRAAFYFLSYFCIKGWLAVMPRKRVPGLTTAGAFSLYGYLLHPFIIWFIPPVQQGVHWAATLAGGQSIDAQVTNVGGILVILAFVVAIWLALSSIAARFVCMMCTEPAIECLFIDPEAPTPILNKDGNGEAARECWECCQCCCCARKLRPLSVTLPEGVVGGQVLTLAAS